MLLICPACKSRYTVPDHFIGAEGRMVRCSNCANQWKQKPHGPDADLSLNAANTRPNKKDTPDTFDVTLSDEDAPDEEIEPSLPDPMDDYDGLDDGLNDERDQEAARKIHKYVDEAPDLDFDDNGDSALQDTQAEDDFDFIPDAVKPNHDDEDFSTFQRPPDPEPDIKPSKTPQFMGYGTAAALFVLIFWGLYSAKDSIVSFWPPSAVVYESLGAEITYPGEGLIFDRVVAMVQTEGTIEKLKLSGNIINLKSRTIKLLPVIAAVKDENGEIKKSWLIDLGKTELPPEDFVSFEELYDIPLKDLSSISISFLAKTPDLTGQSAE